MKKLIIVMLLVISFGGDAYAKCAGVNITQLRENLYRAYYEANQPGADAITKSRYESLKKAYMNAVARGCGQPQDDTIVDMINSNSKQFSRELIRQIGGKSRTKIENEIDERYR